MSAYEPEDVEAVAARLRPTYRDRGKLARRSAEGILFELAAGEDASLAKFVALARFSEGSVEAAFDEARLRLAGRKALREEGDG